MLLALAPGEVRRSRLERGLARRAGDAQALFYPDLRANAPNGVVGDPRGAQASRAARYLEAWLDVLLAGVRGGEEAPVHEGHQPGVVELVRERAQRPAGVEAREDRRSQAAHST